MPLDVFVLKAIVGLTFVDQHTPLAVIVPPPSSVIVPPELAVVFVMLLIEVVVSVGMTGYNVVTVISLPYATPD